MRAIIFRGMDIHGNWHYGNISILTQNVHHIEAGYYISNRVDSPFAYQVRPETVGQYTGLKDKNGKEIYEGDIINQFGSMCGEVFYNDERAIYSIRERPSCPQSDLCFGKHQEEDIEVIGNIYENPELLK